jgi:hypothetical protein
MATDPDVSWLDEALASYRPQLLSPAVWGRFRPDAETLVRRLDLPDVNAARKCLSRLVVYLADMVESRPEADLAALLTRDQVAGHLQRALAAGAARSTVENRQGTLNAMLREVHGAAQPRRARRRPEPHLQPHRLDEVVRAASAADRSTAPGAADLVRVLVCGLAGVALPTRSRPPSVEVSVLDGQIRVADAETVVPAALPLPAAGTVDVAAVERARRWAARHTALTLDVRRLELTRLTEIVGTRPAVVVLAMAGMGRDRLTAAVAAAGPFPEAEVRELLRHPAGR